jgi:hypothetical protein
LESSSEVVFDLASQGKKVLLALTHRKLANRDELMGVSGGWHTHLAVLVEKTYGRVPPAFSDLWRTIDEPYARRIAQ